MKQGTWRWVPPDDPQAVCHDGRNYSRVSLLLGVCSFTGLPGMLRLQRQPLGRAPAGGAALRPGLPAGPCVPARTRGRPAPVNRPAEPGPGLALRLRGRREAAPGSPGAPLPPGSAAGRVPLPLNGGAWASRGESRVPQLLRGLCSPSGLKWGACNRGPSLAYPGNLLSLLGQDAQRLSRGGATPLFPAAPLLCIGHTLDVCETPRRRETAEVLSMAGVDGA